MLTRKEQRKKEIAERKKKEERLKPRPVQEQKRVPPQHAERDKPSLAAKASVQILATGVRGLKELGWTYQHISDQVTKAFKDTE